MADTHQTCTTSSANRQRHNQVLRRHTQIIVTSVGVGAWLGYVYLPNSGAALDVYETMFRSKTVFHSDSVNELIKEVVKDVCPHIPNVNIVKNCNFFPALCHDPLTRGSLKSHAILGYPDYIACESAREIWSRCTIHIPGTSTPVKWTSPQGILISEAFLMNNEAKQFILARELLKLDSNYLRFQAILGGSMYVSWSLSTLFVRKFVLTANVIAKLLQKLNDLMELIRGPSETRQSKIEIRNQFIGINLAIQLALVGICVIIYLNRVNKRKTDIENDANAKVATLGPNYVYGGAQWCDRVLLRNIAFQNTLDPSAKKYLTEEGVRKRGLLRLTLIGLNYVPIGNQRYFFQQKIKESKSEILDYQMEEKETQ